MTSGKNLCYGCLEVMNVKSYTSYNSKMSFMSRLLDNIGPLLLYLK